MTDGAVVVSACLLGLPCRYDGASRPSSAVIEALEGRVVLPVCPEMAAGLGVPRPSFCFAHADTERVAQDRRGLHNLEGRDVAPALCRASEDLVRHVLARGATEGILKARSPSCGSQHVYVGEMLVEGQGVFSRALRLRGLPVCSEEDVTEAVRERA